MKRFLTLIFLLIAGLSVAVYAQKRNQAYEDYIK